jgi:hypothetical protein
MPKDLMFILPYQPGLLTRLSDALASAGINLEGCSLQHFGPEGLVHLLVEDAAGARRAAEQAGFTVRGEQEVIVAPIEDQPGALGRLLAPIADAGVNVDLVYLATNSRIVIGVADIDKARAALRPASR